MANPELDRCLVVGAEEVDWLLCDAYRRWRLLRAKPPIEPFAPLLKGTILSEGAGAGLLTRSGMVEIERIHPGGNFARQREAVRLLDSICRTLQGEAATEILVGSANGTFIDKAERAASAHYFADAATYTPKPALGESVAAGGIWQLICAAQALRTQQLPPILHAPAELGLTTMRASGQNAWRRAVVTICGLNQQVAALALRVPTAAAV